MRVAELQEFLRSLIPPLRACGANSKTIAALESALQALEPFTGLPIEAFAEFLGRAESYDRTGIVPAAAAKPPAKPRAPKAPAAPPYTVDDALRDIRDLYERSVGESVTWAVIADGVKKLETLKKGDLDRVTIGFGVGKPKSKTLSLLAIREKIEDYKKSHQRTQSI